MKWLMRHMKRISSKVFLLIFVGVVIPILCVSFYVKTTYEEYIQKEISNKIISSISKSEEGIYSIFGNMAAISSVFCTNTSVLEALQNNKLTFFEKDKLFDECVQHTIINNMFNSSEMYITLIDQYKHLYTNWPVNYHDYTFLLEQDWVKKSIEKNGHVVWDLFNPSYVLEDSDSDIKYISLARSVLSESNGDYLGTLIISIRQNQLSDVLRQYNYSLDDSAFVCTDEGDIVLSYIADNITPKDAQTAFWQIKKSNQDNTIQPAGGKLRLVSYYTLSGRWTLNGNRLHVLHFTNYQSVQTQMNALAKKMDFVIGLSLFAIVITILFISKAIGKPVRVLAKQMREYDINKELVDFDVARQDEIGDLHRAFYKMTSYISDLFARLNKEYEIKEKYRFESLRAQLNPHFLFNTLNSIRWMAIISNADNIVDSIDALAGMLKYSMTRGEELVSLQDELSNIKSYIYIQNVRYGEQLELEVDFEESVLSLRVIKFILQPIVENAVIHGFKEKHECEKNIIRIYGDVSDGILRIYVEDNGCGISQQVIEDFNSQKHHRDEKKFTGLGLCNIDQRIRITYGDTFGLHIQNNPGIGSVVSYVLPAIIKEDDASDEKNNDCGG